MEQKTELLYFNPKLNIGMKNWRQVYLLHPKVELLIPEVYKGNLVYRQKGTHKRIPYRQIKTGLVKKKGVVKSQVPDWF